MGIIKAVTSAIGGGLADSWLEVIEPDNMGEGTVFTGGVKVRRGDPRNQNLKGTADTVSNGSVIHVYPDQFMLLLDGGKIVDYTAEPGYYTVNNSSLPSLFGGQFGASLKDSFNRVRFAGTTPTVQKVFYVNLQEIKGIKFGSRNPLNYFDTFYNAELFLRVHGTYSVRVIDPIRFFAEAIPRNAMRVQITDINEQYLSEFLEALGAAINQLSAEGVRVSFVPSKGRELSAYMNNVLDETWERLRGMRVEAVGIAGISYDEESQKLINMRNQGAMLGDPNIREGYMQGAVARGLEAAGSNSGGSMMGFMGMGVGMQATGVGAMSQGNNAAAQQQAQAAQQAAPAPAPSANTWTCDACGHANSGKFCAECGKPRSGGRYVCDKCGHELSDGTAAVPKFCPECGDAVNDSDRV